MVIWLYFALQPRYNKEQDCIPEAVMSVTGIKKAAGFTLIELCAVISIIAILATVAVLVYNKFNISKYDSEAIASLHDLYAQATHIVTAWGIVTSGGGSENFGVQANKCLTWTETADVAVIGNEGEAAVWDNPKEWADLGLSLDGTQHWAYQICFGFMRDPNGQIQVGEDEHGPIFVDVATNVEGFVIAAYRKVDNNTRVVLFGSGLEDALIDVSCIPGGAVLAGVNMKDVLGVTLAACP